MLVVSNISKQFPGADEPILKAISFTVNAGERVGLIGPNGCGKSTLLGIVMGHIAPDGGSILYNPRDLRIGYLSQSLNTSDDAPIQDVLLPQATALRQAEADVERLAEQLGRSDGDDLSAAYSDALEKLERLSGEVESRKSQRLLAELELADLPLESPVGTLSGGQKTRLSLAALLLDKPDLLILDEPTNHLDVTGLEWLEGWLNGFQGSALIVSHDRTFLDNTVNRIVAIDHQTHTARVFEGDYTDYASTVRSELDRQWARWRDQRAETARMEADLRRTMGWSRSIENSTNDSSQRRYAKKIAKRAKAKEKRLERYLEAEDRVEKPRLSWNLKLDFGDLPPTGQEVVTLQHVTVGYDPAAPLLSDLNLMLRAGERIAVLGPNGHGKTSLLKTIIGETPPLAGRVRIGASIRIGYLAQEQEILDPQLNALELLQADVTSHNQSLSHTEARSFLHFFLFTGDDVFRPVTQLSFGERVRLMLALLVARGANLLVLDEPINHLDVPSRERFEQALESFQGSVLAVVHDRYFVDRFATTVWHVQNGTLREEIRQPMMA